MASDMIGPRTQVVVLLALVGRAWTADEHYVTFNLRNYTNRPAPRAQACAVLQNTVAETAALGQYVWLFGGLDVSLGALNDLWKLDILSGAWARQTPGGIPPVSRRGATLVLADQRTSYLFGGEMASRQRRNDLFMLHMGTAAQQQPRWEDISTNVTGPVPSARTGHTATNAPLLFQLGSPQGMIVFGGLDGSGTALNDLYELEYRTLEWRRLSPSGVIPQQRKGHTAVLLLNSLVAIFGGSNQDVPVFFGDVHILDIKRNLWIQPTPTGSSSPAGRDGHTMVCTRLCRRHTAARHADRPLTLGLPLTATPAAPAAAPTAVPTAPTPPHLAPALRSRSTRRSTSSEASTRRARSWRTCGRSTSTRPSRGSCAGCSRHRCQRCLRRAGATRQSPPSERCSCWVARCTATCCATTRGR